MSVSRINENECYGCGACANACAKRCIHLSESEKGFYVPILDRNSCNNCDMCETVCPVLNEKSPEFVLSSAYLFINGNDYNRRVSSSGGFVNAAAEYLMNNNNGAVVYGAAFDDDFKVVQKGISEYEKIYELMGSKYVQSYVNESLLKEVKEHLDENTQVLYVGTPCQIAGLKSFLGKEYDNLYTIELICEGVPSPRVWREYLCDYYKNKEIRYIQFRYKFFGWWNHGLRIQFAKDDYYSPTRGGTDPYMQCFMNNLSTSMACDHCRYRRKEHNGDFYIGDAWNVNRIRSNMDDNMGITTVFANSLKAKKVMESLRDKHNIFEITIDEATRFRPDLFESMGNSEKKEMFFKCFEKYGFKKAYEFCIKPSEETM